MVKPKADFPRSLLALVRRQYAAVVLSASSSAAIVYRYYPVVGIHIEGLWLTKQSDSIVGPKKCMTLVRRQYATVVRVA